MNSARANQRAFTLIEIMLVVAIMGIVLMMGYPAISDMVHRAPLSQAARDVLEGCRKARAMAILHGETWEMRITAQDGKIEVMKSPADVDNTANLDSSFRRARQPRRTRLMSGEPAKPADAFSAQISGDVRIELLDVNFTEYKDEDMASVRFYPNGTSDEFTLIMEQRRPNAGSSTGSGHRLGGSGIGPGDEMKMTNRGPKSRARFYPAGGHDRRRDFFHGHFRDFVTGLDQPAQCPFAPGTAGGCGNAPCRSGPNQQACGRQRLRRFWRFISRLPLDLRDSPGADQRFLPGGLRRDQAGRRPQFRDHPERLALPAELSAWCELLEQPMNLHRRKTSGAFTLLEIMVAIALFALIVIAIYSSWNSILKGSRVAMDAAAEAQRTRISMRTLQDSLLCACMFNANATNYAFMGTIGVGCFLAQFCGAFAEIFSAQRQVRRSQRVRI